MTDVGHLVRDYHVVLRIHRGLYVVADHGRLVEAEAAERRVPEISPTYASGPYNLGVVLLALGRSEEALQIVTAQQHPGEERMIGLTIGYHAVGRKAESDAQLAELIREHADDDAFGIAQARAYRGELNEAFKWLDRAYAQKDVGLYLVRGDILLRNIVPGSALQGVPQEDEFAGVSAD